MDYKIKIEVEKFENYYKKALLQIKSALELPGFRVGTVPEKILEEKIGQSEILEEAAELAIRDEWTRILRELEEKNIEAVGRPQVEITKIAKGNPFEFKIQISVIDKINLPDYKKIAKEILKENLEKEKEIRQKGELRMKTLDEISQKTKIDLPEILIESELNRMTAEYKSSVSDMGIKWEDYLKSLKNIKSENDLKKNWREDAVKRAKYGLVLREIAKKENLIPLNDFLEKETEEFLRKMTDEERKKVSKENIKEYLFGRTRNEMVFDFLEKQV